MTGIIVEPRNRAHLMIEEFMLVANEVVAGHLERHDAPCLYRVHDAPDPAKLAALEEFAEGFGVELPVAAGEPEPGRVQQLLEAVEGRPESRVIGQMALFAMQQARYSVANTGHFGLAAPVYCHFTSPIRRYPDLVVHRQLRQLRYGGGEESVVGDESLETVARDCSETERNAEAAERELLSWKKVAFIADSVGENFDGIVTGVTRFGVFVQLVENLVEGLVKIELLGREWFDFDADRFELKGSESGVAYRLGDPLRVSVDRVDRVLRRVDLSPVETSAPPAGRRRRGTRRRSPTGGRR
jgi:ribonuclease R